MYDVIGALLDQGIPQLLILTLSWCSFLAVVVRAVLRLLLAQEAPERRSGKAT